MFKNIKLIYQRDLKAIFKYKAALLTISALCILPCLYTLVNVKAIWNPYTSHEVQKFRLPSSITIKAQRFKVNR